MDRDRALHVFDATAQVFRAYHGRTRAVAPNGREMGALRGLVDITRRLLTALRPTHAVAVFDTGRKTFRHDLFPGYKARRPPAPADLKAQLELAPRALEALGVATLQTLGFEADDLMATLAARARAAAIDAVLVTPDKDALQLMGPGVRVYDPRTERAVNEADVATRFGVRPAQIVDLLALAGDPSDDIPGAPGIGMKTGAALLRAFGDLESLYRRLDEVETMPLRGASALRRKLEAGRASAELSRQLALLRTDAPLGPEPLSLSSFRFPRPRPAGAALKEALGFTPGPEWLAGRS